MILHIFAGKVFGGAVVGAAGYLAVVDPAWAIPANTALLILMLVVQRLTHVEAKKAAANSEHASVSASAAASAAASAVQAQTQAAAMLPHADKVIIERSTDD